MWTPSCAASAAASPTTWSLAVTTSTRPTRRRGSTVRTLIRFPYGREGGYDKCLMEEAARRAATEIGVRVTMLRYPAIYGPGDTTPREWYYVRQALDGRRIVLPPNGGQAVFSRGYLENMAHAVALAVDAPSAGD